MPKNESTESTNPPEKQKRRYQFIHESKHIGVKRIKASPSDEQPILRKVRVKIIRPVTKGSNFGERIDQATTALIDAQQPLKSPGSMVASTGDTPKSKKTEFSALETISEKDNIANNSDKLSSTSTKYRV